MKKWLLKFSTRKQAKTFWSALSLFSGILILLAFQNCAAPLEDYENQITQPGAGDSSDYSSNSWAQIIDPNSGGLSDPPKTLARFKSFCEGHGASISEDYLNCSFELPSIVSRQSSIDRILSGISENSSLAIGDTQFEVALSNGESRYIKSNLSDNAQALCKTAFGGSSTLSHLDPINANHGDLKEIIESRRLVYFDNKSQQWEAYQPESIPTDLQVISAIICTYTGPESSNNGTVSPITPTIGGNGTTNANTGSKSLCGTQKFTCAGESNSSEIGYSLQDEVFTWKCSNPGTSTSEACTSKMVCNETTTDLRGSCFGIPADTGPNGPKFYCVNPVTKATNNFRTRDQCLVSSLCSAPKTERTCDTAGL